MSFEGYWEWKCKCGNTHAADVYDYSSHLSTCPKRGEQFTHQRLVDQTKEQYIGLPHKVVRSDAFRSLSEEHTGEWRRIDGRKERHKYAD